jgi:hypothetical protein
MTDTALLEQAKQVTPRREDQAFNEAELLKILANLLDSNRGAERRRQAENIIDHHCRHGSTCAHGTLRFPGLEPFPYEPDRLVRDGEGHIVELSEATLPFVIADAKRAETEAEEAAEWLNIVEGMW